MFITNGTTMVWLRMIKGVLRYSFHIVSELNSIAFGK